MALDLNEAGTFVSVVQAGGFSAAARRLNLPVSTVSTRVSRLEARLGVTLLQRTTRRLSLTEAGTLYFRHASEGLGQLQEAEAAIGSASGEVKGLLRVSALADLGDEVMARIVAKLRSAHPQVQVDLMLENRYVDLVAEGIDVAIRAGALRDSSLVAKQVGMARWAPFASPAYLKDAPPLDRPQQLRQHRCLQFAPLGRDHWTLSGPRGSVTIPLAGAVLANHIGVVHALALAGEGIALLPTFVGPGEGGKSSKLQRVLPGWQARGAPLHLVYPRQRFVPPRLRAFIDIASSELTAWLGR